MQTKGKFYIRLNVPASINYYWNQLAQNWTSKATDATFFDLEVDAIAEAVRAEAYSDGEALVVQATRDLP